MPHPLLAPTPEPRNVNMSPDEWSSIESAYYMAEDTRCRAIKNALPQMSDDDVVEFLRGCYLGSVYSATCCAAIRDEFNIRFFKRLAILNPS